MIGITTAIRRMIRAPSAVVSARRPCSIGAVLGGGKGWSGTTWGVGSAATFLTIESSSARAREV
jgi:hypothetical protein